MERILEEEEVLGDPNHCLLPPDRQNPHYLASQEQDPVWTALLTMSDQG